MSTDATAEWDWDALTDDDVLYAYERAIRYGDTTLAATIRYEIRVRLVEGTALAYMHRNREGDRR